MKCRHCNAEVSLPFVDLGFAPPSNAYLTADQLDAPELTFPLKVMVCEKCWLVQTKDFARADELFDAEYAYFSSTSKGWLDHAERFAEMAIERFELGTQSHVVEIASNDGYLLRNFVEAKIPCLGVEPTRSTSLAAEKLGIPQYRAFFGEALAKTLRDKHGAADLMVANNVLAHVPDINDFCQGFKTLLKPEGVVSFEFPHLLNLIAQNQFDTVYHEHFSYLSLSAVSTILSRVGLEVFDVESIPTHGGSLRVFASHKGAFSVSTNVAAMLRSETDFGLNSATPYLTFQAKAEAVKNGLLRFLLNAKAEGRSVAAYGAAAKGNTLLNFAGVGPDLIKFVCDAAPSKQHKFLPGSHIPILPPSALENDRPDILLILPWNIANEVAAQNQSLRTAGTEFFVAVPEMRMV